MKQLVFLVIFFLLVGCVPNLDSNGELARQYLLDKGYKIKSYEGSQVYSVSKEELTDMPDISIWAVQPVQPDSYIGKEIVQEIFIVVNHPLSKIYGPQQDFSEKVKVRAFIYNGEVIGGTSYPVGEGIGGWGYSIDGKTAEEVQGQDLNVWSEKWRDKYEK